MALGDSFPVFGDWFYINFVENNGMAWGMSFGGEWGKLFLSLFRIVAIGGINLENYKEVIDARADGLASISDIVKYNDVKERILKINSYF